MKIFFFGALLIAISGCATSGNYVQYLRSWVGASENELVHSKAFGIPDGSYENDGKKYLTFIEDMGEYFCKTTFTIEDGKITHWKYNGNYCVSKKTSRFEK